MFSIKSIKSQVMRCRWFDVKSAVVYCDWLNFHILILSTIVHSLSKQLKKFKKTIVEQKRGSGSSHLSLFLRLSSTLPGLTIPLVHVVLDLCHDVLRALHCHRDPPQIGYLDLLLKGLRHESLLVLSTFSPRMSSCTSATSSQSRPRGKTLVGRLLRLSFLKGVEALDLRGRVEVVSWVGALRQGSKERPVTRTARDQGPVIAEPARRLSTSVTYHLAIVLAEI